jgi:hypothetical protein
MIRVLQNLRSIKRDVALRLLREDVERLGRDLSMRIEKVDLDEQGWALLEFSGADSEILTEIVRKEYGIAPSDISELERSDIIRGIVVSSTIGYGIYLDIGLRSSNGMDALYRLHSMRSQLADGATVPARQIAKRFCLQEGFPLEVRVTNVDTASRKVDIELSDRQVSYFKDWERFPFDRVILIGCSKSVLKETIDLTGLKRDLADVETLSLTTHVLLCKLGTDAPGIIAKIGRRLMGVRAYAFQPRVRWLETQRNRIGAERAN